MAVTLLCSVSGHAFNDDFDSEWSTQLSLSQIGGGDLQESYEQVIDYLLPRKPARQSSGYLLVLRYTRSGHPESQLNIHVTRDNNKLTISAWSLELPFELGTRLNSSEVARQLASETRVVKKLVCPSPELERLISQRLSNGFSTRLHEGIVIHGDMYDFWATVENSVLEVHQIPGKSRDELTHWMEQMRLAAEKCGPLQN